MNTASTLAFDPSPNQSLITEHSSSTPHCDAAIWQSLLPKDSQDYQLYLAFEQGKIADFKTGYIAIKQGNTVVGKAPYFVTDYLLPTKANSIFKRILAKISLLLPQLFTVRVLCLGSPVTYSCKIAGLRNPDIVSALCKELEILAQQENACVIAFKGILESELEAFNTPLKNAAYQRIAHSFVASNSLNFENIDAYMGSLSLAARRDLRSKLKSLDKIRIMEYQGAPPDMQAIYDLYLLSYQASSSKFEKLTLAYFEAIARLMPEATRFVLYYAEENLIAFSLLLQNNDVLLNQYTARHPSLAKPYHIYYLCWLNHIEIALREHCSVYQSGQTKSRIKASWGATLEPTYIFLKHRSAWKNKLIKLMARFAH
jgi:Peptidogalycan biosysnthesis/recognition